MLSLKRKKKRKKRVIFIASLILIIAVLAVGLVFLLKNKDNTKQTEARWKNKNVKQIIPKKQVTLQKVGLVAPWRDKRSDGKKIAYLTFDDGPSTNTTAILNILKHNNIKANFFIIGKNAEEYPNLVKEEASDGEIIGNHTYSHPIHFGRETTEAFVQDVDKCNGVLRKILGNGKYSNLLRFPGGSFDPKNKPDKYKAYRDAVTEKGYRYMDWNDETGDADSNNPSIQYLLVHLKQYTSGKNTVVILMHDAGAKKNTVVALQSEIDYLKAEGFSFDVVR